MSWSLAVSHVLRENFNQAVDAAEPVGDNANTESGAVQVLAAKAAMKVLAVQVQRPKIGGNAGGHALQEGDGANYFDGMSVSVNGSE